MDQIVFIETGMGTDVHGQDITNAAVRAVNNAVRSNSMPGIKNLLPNHSLDNMKVNVKLALPCDKDQLDKEKVKKTIPYGQVNIEIMDGGMLTTSGIKLEDQGDNNDMMYIVNAAVEVGY
ncbi:Lin0512 family protein [Halobacillus salinarum]|uniref:Lin0512 family protein n=1 Tax=Halobacillus salinarum TaxID=2932257 RepID=A0ABY4EGS3_9BACI|nr:Lin0512 family protein [Halobacillus salinarum]UOQ43675.1 Lin0512 family protein [Halobacillus salinarum]